MMENKKFYFPFNYYSLKKDRIKAVIKGFNLKWYGKGWSGDWGNVHAIFEGSGKPATFTVSGDDRFVETFRKMALECGAEELDYEKEQQKKLDEEQALREALEYNKMLKYFKDKEKADRHFQAWKKAQENKK